MFKSIILPLALEDIREAAIWYNNQQKGLGNRFTNQVRDKVHFIQQNPNTYKVRHANVRTAVLNIFPFMLHYTVDETTC